MHGEWSVAGEERKKFSAVPVPVPVPVRVPIRVPVPILDFDLDPYIRKTPKRVSGMGALRVADIASESTLRVSAGSITPSSQSRALA